MKDEKLPWPIVAMAVTPILGILAFVAIAVWLKLDARAADTITITHIRDADTVCERQEGPCYRLQGVDAPERGDKCQAALEARVYGLQWWSQYMHLPYKITGRFGKSYDREVVTMRGGFRGYDVGTQLLNAGAVKPWPHDPKTNKPTAPRPVWCP